MNKVMLYEDVGDNIGCVELIDHMGSDLTVVNAARVSFGAHKEELDARDEKLINYLAEHRHTSPFEHCSVTFRVKVPLFVRSQHHRHRVWKFNETSRRYTAENIEFFAPTLYRAQHKSNRQASIDEPKRVWLSDGRGDAHEAFVGAHSASERLFEHLLEAGVCREQARGVLPQNLYTTYYATVDLSNLMKFYTLRTHEGAQWEIRRLAEGMAELVKPLFPVAWAALLKRAQMDNEKPVCPVEAVCSLFGNSNVDKDRLVSFLRKRIDMSEFIDLEEFGVRDDGTVSLLGFLNEVLAATQGGKEVTVALDDDTDEFLRFEPRKKVTSWLNPAWSRT